MIIINLMGGLGNQMFQYAAARHLALRQQTTLKIDATRFGRMTLNKEHVLQLGHFKISAPQASDEEVERFVPGRGRLAALFRRIARALTPRRGPGRQEGVYEEPPGSRFKPDFFDLGPDRYLIGTFNSYRYFDPIRDLLLDEYTPRHGLSAPAAEMVGRIEGAASVGIHIRRGDYVTDPGVQRCVEGIITDRYYRNAVAYIRQRVAEPHFFVFSDDMPWVKEHFRLAGKVTPVDINPPQRGFEDLWMMSRCRHIITAGGSTFSWWAAYLNRHPDRIVVRTEQISTEAAYNHPGDYFPPGWVAVPS
jgi:hypothetical protein